MPLLPPPLHLGLGVKTDFQIHTLGIWEGSCLRHNQSNRKIPPARFSASSFLHWAVEKKTCSTGYISGITVSSLTTMGKWKSTHHPLFSAWHLCINQLFWSTRSLFSRCLWRLVIFDPAELHFSLHFFQNHRLDQTTSRWSSWCTDIAVPTLGLGRPQGIPAVSVGMVPWRKLPLAYLKKTEAACNTPLSGMERSICKVLQSIQRSITPVQLPTCPIGFTAL